jgi:hypothetical protein
MEDSNRLPDREFLAQEIIKSQEKTLKQFLGHSRRDNGWQMMPMPALLLLIY